MVNEMEDRLLRIRQAEEQSHTEAYSSFELFSDGSWLSKPVKTVLDLLPCFKDYKTLRVLDLGCGVGRNSIPVAEYFREIPCRIECVDILEMAVSKLMENAARYGASEAIHGIVEPIDDYQIAEDSFDFIMAISALEHMDSQESFIAKLVEIRSGLRNGGIGCLIMNSSVREQCKITGEEQFPQFELNIPTEKLQEILANVFQGWEILKNTVVHQKYDIPREYGLSALETDVVTYVVRRK